MEEKSLQDLAKGLAYLLKKDMEKPFPYSDCRKAAALVGLRPGDVIPDLDVYFSELAGYCSWDGRILKWPPQKIATVRKQISKPFFERHAQYRVLQRVISEAETPDLVRDLALHEEMRNTLIAVLEQLQREGRAG
jgi:hypothetical protein